MQMNFHSHIVVQFNASNVTDIGLASLIMPLRASCIQINDLKDIVLIVDPDLVKEEWQTIRCIPRLFFFKVSFTQYMAVFDHASQCLQCSPLQI